MALIVKGKNKWQERGYVLGNFHEKEGKAIWAIRRIMGKGTDQGQRPELVGGGLIRSLGGQSQVLVLRGNLEMSEHSDRVLGTGDFVAEILKEANKNVRRYKRVCERKKFIDKAIREICPEEGFGEQELRMGVRRWKILRFERGFGVI